MNDPGEIPLLQAEDRKIPIDVPLVGDTAAKETGGMK